MGGRLRATGFIPVGVSKDDAYEPPGLSRWESLKDDAYEPPGSSRWLVMGVGFPYGLLASCLAFFTSCRNSAR